MASAVHSHLNDMGVALLEQNYYRQAFTTFRDAMQTLKRVSQSVKEDSLPTVDTSLLLEDATAWLVSLEPFTPPASSIKISSISALDLATVDDIAVLEKKLQVDHGVYCYLAIRMGKEDSSHQTQDNISKDLAAAIITYNYGIAHQAYTSAMWNANRPANIQRQTGPRLLGLSETILDRLSSPPEEDDANDENQRQVLLVHLIILMCLHGEVVDASRKKKVRDKLLDIHSRILTTFYLVEMAKECCISAVAAWILLDFRAICNRES
jgi:hypothetical protein